MQEVEIFERFKHKNILRMLAYTVVESESSYGAQEYLLLLEYYPVSIKIINSHEASLKAFPVER